jgi:hypothetical protein
MAEDAIASDHHVGMQTLFATAKRTFQSYTAVYGGD